MARAPNTLVRDTSSQIDGLAVELKVPPFSQRPGQVIALNLSPKPETLCPRVRTPSFSFLLLLGGGAGSGVGHVQDCGPEQSVPAHASTQPVSFTLNVVVVHTCGVERNSGALKSAPHPGSPGATFDRAQHPTTGIHNGFRCLPSSPPRSPAHKHAQGWGPRPSTSQKHHQSLSLLAH